MMMKATSTTLSLLLFLLPTLTLASTNYRWTNETLSNYVPFPEELQTRLANELQIYKSNNYPLPTLRAFQTFPEQQPRIWLLLKAITTRLHPIMWPHVHYQVQEGLEIGCRLPVQGSQETAPVTSGHCHRHCLHQGRYCLPHPGIDNRYGRGLVKEVIRRLCMDTIYHAKDIRFFNYIEEFDRQDCLHQQDVKMRNCSITAMNTVDMKWKEIEECVAEDLIDQDVPHPIMNRNLRHIKAQAEDDELFNVKDKFPMITIEDQVTSKGNELTTANMFYDYCNAFPSFLQQPLACHLCMGCDNVRDCLWTLTCNGQNVNPQSVNPDVLGMTGDHPEVVAVETVAPTTQAEPVYQDNQHNGGGVVNPHDKDRPHEDPDEDSVDAAAAALQTGGDDDMEEFNADKENEGKGGLVFWGICLTLGPLLCGIMFAYYYSKFRHERARKLLSEIAAGKYSQGTVFGLYRDNSNSNSQEDLPAYAADHNNSVLGGRKGDEHDESGGGDYRERAHALLKANSAKDLQQPSSSPNNSSSDLLDTTVETVDEDIQVEELLDEESEWVEHKRGTGTALPAELKTPGASLPSELPDVV